MNKSDNHSDTQTRLLDTAERLFGDFGYDGVGLRTISQEAEVNLGAATYHFGSKENLYKQTFLRRFLPVNQRGLSLLEEAKNEAKGKVISVERLLECIIAPPFLLVYSHPSFFKLVSQNMVRPPSFMQEAIDKEHRKLFPKFIECFAVLYPTLSDETILKQMQFSVGAMFFSVAKNFGHSPSPSEDELNHQLDHLLHFCAAGFEGVARATHMNTKEYPLYETV